MSGGGQASIGGGPASIADVTQPLQIFASQDVGELGGTSYPQEPQVAKAGGVVLYSGNTNGAVSFDAGSTFQTLDPARVFGNDQPLCCDTVVRYAPSINRFVWVLQYWCPWGTVNGQRTADCDLLTNKQNRYRIAVISPSQLLAHRSDPTRGWSVYELSASAFSSSTWLDYPDISIGAHDLYMSCDEVGVGGLNIRFPLTDLTRSGTPSAQWFRGSSIFWRTAENSGSTGIYLKGDTDSRDQAYIWPDGSPFAFAVGLPHTTRPDFNYSSVTQSGQDWNDRAGSPVVKGATMSNGRLWVAWAAGRWYNAHGSGPKYPQPHIQIAVYDLSLLPFPRLVDERFIWSPTTAYTDPILATNSENDVALTFSGADAHSMPSPYVAVLTNRQFVRRAALSIGPTTAVEGDYAGLTRDFDSPTRWVAANPFTSDAGASLGVHWLYTNFGRGPAPPPPASPTSITINSVTGTSFECCFYGDTFHTNGTLAGAPSGSPVVIDYFTSAQNFTHIARTDTAGNFTDAWTVPTSSASQIWTVVAHYPGDGTHQPSDSDPYYQNVQPPPS